MMEVRWQAGSDAVLLGMAGFVKRPEGLRFTFYVLPAYVSGFEIDFMRAVVHGHRTREKTGSVRLARSFLAGCSSAHMNFEPMLFCLLLGCLITLLTIPLLLLPGLRASILDEASRLTGARSRGVAVKASPSKLGGVSLVVAFTVVSLMVCFLYPAAWKDGGQVGLTVLLSGLAVFGIGLWDDFRPLGFRRRLILQALVAAFTCFQGVQIEVLSSPLAEAGMNVGRWSAVATLFWMVLFIALFQRINSVNGLAGCLGLISMGLLAYGAAASGPAFSGLCAIGMAGALVGFLVYSLPPAKIQLGSSGAGLLGFLIGNLSITHPDRDHQSAMVAMLIVAVSGASYVTWRAAVKLLPTTPLSPKLSARPVSRLTSPHMRARR